MIVNPRITRVFRLCILMAAVCILIWNTEGYARGSYLAQWSATYPDSSSDDLDCQLCHQRDTGGNGWNQYGCAIRPEYLANVQSNGGDEADALANALDAVEGLRFPGVLSGPTFLDEIRYNTQPGWVDGENNIIKFRPDCGGGTGDVPTVGLLPPNLAPEDVTKIDLDLSGEVANPGVSPTGSTIMLQLEEVAGSFNAPVKAVAAPGINGSIFVVEQRGKIFRVDLTTREKTLFHDVSSQLVPAQANFDERGLLGLAFHPDYENNGLFYTFQSEPSRASEDGNVDFTTLLASVAANHRAKIVEYKASDASCNSPIQQRKTLMIVDEPQFNHNGGDLVFGPDGFLYASFGDGGGADDQGNGNNPAPGFDGHGLLGNGRDIDSILGTIIRIDPTGTNSSNGKYGIPASNPFTGVGDGLDEIFAYGFRNPYRFSFDSLCFEAAQNCNTLTAADVGQNKLEEIDEVVSGGNYGWNYKEGSFFFIDLDGEEPLVTVDAPPGVPQNLIDPIAEYGRDTGISITGGYTYRGDNIAGLNGRYVFADFFIGGGQQRNLMVLDGNNDIEQFLVPVVSNVTGFGQDSEGELYIVSNPSFGDPLNTQGTLQKLMQLNSAYTPPDGTGETAQCPPPEDLCITIKGSNSNVINFCL